MNDSILPTLSHYIAVEILRRPDKAISPADPLISSGLVDSFHLVDLALFIEDTFGVHIDDTELTVETFNTLAQIEAIIRQRLPPGA